MSEIKRLEKENKYLRQEIVDVKKQRLLVSDMNELENKDLLKENEELKKYIKKRNKEIGYPRTPREPYDLL